MTVRTALSAAALLALCATGASATPPATPVEAMLAAAGRAVGADAAARAGGLVLTGTVNISGLRGTFAESRDLVTGVYAVQTDAGPQSGLNGWDGAHAWNADPGGFVWDDGSAAALDAERARALIGTYALFRRGHGGAAVAAAGTMMISGRPADLVRFTPPGTSQTFVLALDRVTHLPVRMTAQLDTAPMAQTYRDWRRVGAVGIPFRVTTTTEQGVFAATIETAHLVSRSVVAAATHHPRTAIRDTTLASPEVRVPFELQDNHVMLDVTIDGKGPYRFAFDTGGQNLLDTGIAKELGIAGAGAISGGGVGSQQEQFSFAKVRSLQVGGVTLRDQSFVLLPVHAGFGAGAGKPVDGIIGFEVLGRLLTTFDYENRAVIFRAGDAALPSGTVVPFTFMRTQPRIACRIAALPARCAIDTGSRTAISLTSPFLAAHPEVVPANATAVGANGFGVGGASIGRLGRLTLEIGGATIPDVIADFSTQRAGAFASHEFDGNVGGAVFDRFTLTFDYRNARMVFAPNGRIAERETYDRSGLFLTRRGGNVVVADVRPGTPGADAGVRTGDVITQIDGADAAGRELADLRSALRGAPGTVVTLGLRAKDGAERTVRLTLRDYV